MKKFILKISILFILVISIDIILGNIIENFFYKQVKGKSYRIKNVLENVTSDILILGSSRAVQHYDPSIIQQKTGLTTYNAGLDGQSIIYQKAILDIILHRYTPKVIVLELYEIMDFPKNNIPYDRLSVLLPYVNKYPVLNNVINKRSFFEKYKRLSKTYPYNSLLLRIIEGNLALTKTGTSSTGFIPKEGIWELPIKKKESTNFDYDNEKVQFYYDIINSCKEREIPLFVVISPKYEDCVDCFSFSQKISDMTNTQLNNYSKESLFISNNKYFENPSHLNSDGAKIYSNFFGDKLNDWIKSRTNLSY